MGIQPSLTSMEDKIDSALKVNEEQSNALTLPASQIRIHLVPVQSSMAHSTSQSTRLGETLQEVHVFEVMYAFAASPTIGLACLKLRVVETVQFSMHYVLVVSLVEVLTEPMWKDASVRLRTLLSNESI